MTKLDLAGYWKIPLHKELIPLTDFVAPHGHYQWKYRPMALGVHNAPVTIS